MVHFLTQITNFVLGNKCDEVVCAEIERNKRVTAFFDAKCVDSPADTSVLLEYAEFLKTLQVGQNNHNKIIQLYKKGMDMGCCIAKMRLGEFYMDCALEELDEFDCGYALLLELVKTGFAPACIALGNYYVRKQNNVVQTYYWYVFAMDICKDDEKRAECVKWLKTWFGDDVLRGMLMRDGKEVYCKFL